MIKKVIYKLLAIKGNLFFVKEHDLEFLTLSTFQKDIQDLGFNDKFDNILFLYRNKKLEDMDIKISDDTIIILIFSKKDEIKIKLKEAFETVAVSNEPLTHQSIARESMSRDLMFRESMLNSSRGQEDIKNTSLPQQDLNKKIIINIPSLKDDDMIQHNEEILKILKDPDFINLMKIYKTKPDLLSFMYNYISSGNIVKDTSLPELNEEWDDNEEKVLLEIKVLVESFQFKTDDNTIKQLVKQFNGNCSLIFRYIYQNNCTS